MRTDKLFADEGVGGRVPMKNRRESHDIRDDSKIASGERSKKPKITDLGQDAPAQARDDFAYADSDSSEISETDRTEEIPPVQLKEAVQAVRSAIGRAEKTVLLAWENRGKFAKNTRMTEKMRDDMIGNLYAKRDRIDALLKDAGMNADDIRRELDIIGSDIPDIQAKETIDSPAAAVGMEVGSVAADEIIRSLSDRDAGTPIVSEKIPEKSDDSEAALIGLEEAKQIASDQLLRIRSEILEEIRNAAAVGDIPALKKIRKSDRWRLFDPKKIGLDGLPDAERQEIVDMLVAGSKENGHVIKREIAGILDGIGNSEAPSSDTAPIVPTETASAVGTEEDPVSPGEKLIVDGLGEKSAVDAMMAEARENAEESVAEIPKIMHSRRNGEKSSSLDRAVMLDERRKAIEALRIDAKNQGARVAELETVRQQEQERFDKAKQQNDRYKKIKGVLGKWFGSEETVAKKLQDEEAQNQRHLDDLEREIVEETRKRDRLRAELSDMEGEFQESESEAMPAELKRMADASFGSGNYVLEKNPESAFDGVHDDSASEAAGTGDPVFEAAATGVGMENIPEGDTVGIDVWNGSDSRGTNEKMPSVEKIGGGAIPGTEVESPRKEGRIYDGIAGRFVGEFGIERADLESIWGFDQLSEGQQMLVFENLKQLTLGRIQEEAEKKADREKRESGFLGKIWKSMSKKYQIAKAEKSTAQEIMSGGIRVHGKILEQLVFGMSKGPEAEIGTDGKTVEIKFSCASQNLSESDRSAADDFDRVANEFARMPYEWSLPTATDDERARYLSAQGAYKEALSRFGDIVYSNAGSLPEAHLILNDMDGRVQMMQFLQTHPELEERLDDLREQSAWRTMLNTVVAERGAYLAYGYLGRTFLAGAFGWAAAPVVAAGAGGFVSWKRSKETLRSNDAAARRGKKDKSSEAKNVVTVKGLSDKLERLVQKIEAAPGERGQAEAVLSLKTRMEYTRRKVEEGLVDFGEKPESRVWEQYDLLQLLARAEAVAGVYSGENKALNDRLTGFLDFKEKKISAARKKYIRNQVLKGVAISGGFGLAGAGVRWISELASDHAVVSEGVTGEPSAYLKSTAEPMESPAEAVPVPKSPAPDSVVPPALKEDWDLSDNGAIQNASYRVPEAPVSETEGIGEPMPRKAMEVGSEAGVKAEELHGRVSRVGEIGKGMSPEEQATILSAGQSVADQGGMSAETQAVIAEQEAAERAALDAENVSGKTEGGEASKAVSEAWSESAEKAKLATGNDLAQLGERVPEEISLDSRLASEQPTEIGAVNPPVETGSNPLSAEEKANIDLGITHETEQVSSAEQVAEAVPADAPPMRESIPESLDMVKSDEVRGYLSTHPEHVEIFRKSLADYDTSIFESAHGGTGARGVANMAELNDVVKAKQVMYDCLKLIRDPLTPTYEVRTYQLANSLNFDQMKNVGEFMMKASERFGKGAFPMGDESLRGYLERMTALFVERGETVKLNGDTRLLKQLAFQGIKR
ncbi:MAG: hypothetical protein KBD19_03740 [Candidatus Moranbacteria bacterium]|nr:hypothetical protein [Candidatus Moranbacteria bacterium]